MIDGGQARQVVLTWLAEHPAGIAKGRRVESVLLENETIEAEFGWIFFYTSKLYDDPGDPRHAVAGNAPLIVDRDDGSLHVTGTAQPIEHYIEEYRRNWKGHLAHFPCPCCGYLTFHRQPGCTFDLN